MPVPVESSKPPKPKKVQLNTYPFWSPRFWHGMRVRAWFRLLARHRFRIHPLRIPMAAIITVIAFINSALYRIERLWYGRRVDATQIEQPPVFIIGHWRSGTTYLHELMVRDDRFAFPTTYQCFAPSHFLISQWNVPYLMWFLLPAKRPMDNMAAGFDHPQEDEFALCAMGAPTPYERMAFPNDPPPYMELLDMQDVDERDLKRFKDSLLEFVKKLTLKTGKRLIMKSPPHTGRIKLLAEMFPDARFVHIVRDPLVIFPSTRRLWPALDAAQGFQFPRNEHLDEYVFECFERMYRGFESQRPSIDPSRICDVRYEDLVRDPIGQVRAVYEKLELGDFEPVRKKLEEFVSKQKDYKVNRHELEPEITAEIRRRWAGYFEKYGYE
jgi:hypothetical protein